MDNKTKMDQNGPKCAFASSEDGKNSQQVTVGYKQTDLEIPIGQSDHDYCRIPPKQTECKSRLGVSPCREQLRMETFARGIPSDM